MQGKRGVMEVVCWFRGFGLEDLLSVLCVTSLLLFFSTTYALRILKVIHLLWNGVAEYYFV